VSMKVFITRRVEGPNESASRASIGAAINRRWRQVVDFFSSPSVPDAPAQAKATVWAYRLTNYRRLRAAGVACVVAPPKGAAGISCHLDLEAIEPQHLAPGDVVLVEPGQVVPVDSVILEGTARIDESAVVGFAIRQPRVISVETNVMRGSVVVTGQIIAEVLPPRGHPLDWLDHGRKGNPCEKAPVAGGNSRYGL
jgi:E1-E2 ATPase